MSLYRDRIQLRPNHYPDGPYLDSPCIHCRQMLRHTGATSGTTWVPADSEFPHHKSGHPDTCDANEVGVSAFGQHEPWEAIRVRDSSV